MKHPQIIVKTSFVFYGVQKNNTVFILWENNYNDNVKKAAKKQQKSSTQITLPSTFKSFIIQPTLCQNNCDYSCRHDENKHNWLITKTTKMPNMTHA